jgi:glyoxylase-like metal-dependent hydrolase (beta-lactamase superfamily II)
MPDTPPAWARKGLTVLERGWLSSNNVLLHGGGVDDPGATLVDSGHTVHAQQTLALLQQALGGERLLRVVNTHLHSDHCGGNAALQRQWHCRITTPPGHHQAARDWDQDRLSYRATGQICERFVPDDCIHPGSTLAVGGRQWQALGAPGHDPHSLMLFDAQDGVLISADALWENGYGVVFPELDGQAAFDEVAAVLDLIESLQARWVIPGHGAPFADVPGALQRARRLLARQVADPAGHARHGVRVMVKYHLMELGRLPLAAFDSWFVAAPLCHTVWQRLGQPAGSLHAFGRQVLQQLLASGALTQQGEELINA